MTWVALALLLASGSANALFTVTEPWVRPASAAKVTSGYMLLTSTEGATLVGAVSPDARRVELRGAEPMAACAELPLPPRAVVALAPGRCYLHLEALTRPLRRGDRVAIVLHIRDAAGALQDIQVDAEVRLRSPSKDHGFMRKLH